MAELPKLTLKTAPLQINPLQFAAFTPQQADTNLLANSVKQIEDRQNKASEAQMKINSALGEYGKKLNAKESEWFNNYTSNINNQIQQFAASGNYGDALRKAMQLAGNIDKDPALIGRIKYNQDREKTLENIYQKRQNDKIGKDTYEWAIAQNEYSYLDNYDNNGNILQGDDFKANVPYDDLNLSEEVTRAFNMISVNRRAVGDTKENSTTRKGYTHYAPGKEKLQDGAKIGIREDGTKFAKNYDFGYTSSDKTTKGYTKTEEWIAEQSIRGSLNQLIYNNDGHVNDKIHQKFEVECWALERKKEKLDNLLKSDIPNTSQIQSLQKEIKDAKELLYKNGSPDYEEWYVRMIMKSKFPTYKSFYNTQFTTNSGTDNTRAYTINENNLSSGGTDKPQVNKYGFPIGGTAKAPNTEQSINTNEAEEGVNTASKYIIGYFTK